MIRFHTEEVLFPAINQDNITDWIAQTASSFGKKVGEIHYIFCSESKMLEINQTFLDHHHQTDIITFDYSEKDRISGDIYIGTETVTHNAKSFSTSFETELHRVIIHGILHLCGQKDKTPEENEKMRQNENIALENFYKIFTK